MQPQINIFEVGPSSLPAALSPVAPLPNQEKPPSPLPGTTVTPEEVSSVETFNWCLNNYGCRSVEKY